MGSKIVAAIIALMILAFLALMFFVNEVSKIS